MSKADKSKKFDTPNVDQYIHQGQGTSTEKSETPRKKLSLNDKTLTTRRKMLLDVHLNSPNRKDISKNNKNSSQVSSVRLNSE